MVPDEDSYTVETYYLTSVSLPLPFFFLLCHPFPSSLPSPLPLFSFPLPLLFLKCTQKILVVKTAGEKNQEKCIYSVIQGERTETVEIWMDTVSARTPDMLY